MDKKKPVIFGLGALATLALSFQNCSPSRFSESGAVTQASEGTSPSTPTIGGTDPRQDDPGEVLCDQSLIQAPIAITARDGSQAVAMSSGTLSGSISANKFSAIENFSADTLSVNAYEITTLQNFSVSSLSVNASIIDHIGGGSAGSVTLVADQMSDPSALSGNFCAGVHTLQSIHAVSGSYTIFGRENAGARATLGSVSGASGLIAIYDADLTSLDHVATRAKLVNVQLKSLSAMSGEIDLVDSSIASITQSSGTIHLRGTSTVGAMTNSSVRVIRD